MCVVLGLGSNVGSREAFLVAACGLLEAHPEIAITARSSIYLTEPLGPSTREFVNAAVRLRTSLGPAALLEAGRVIEDQLGRRRDVRWGARTIDIDLLVFGDITRSGPGLTLPHPRLTARAFALVPMLEIAPELAPRYRDVARRLGPLEPRPWTAPITVGARARLDALCERDAWALAHDFWWSREGAEDRSRAWIVSFLEGTETDRLAALGARWVSLDGADGVRVVHARGLQGRSGPRGLVIEGARASFRVTEP